MRRLGALLAVLLVAGCGGDDAETGAGGAATAIPPGTPVVIGISADLESDQWESALAFAERVDPADTDLTAALTAELFDGEVSYDEVEPFLGDRLAFGLTGVQDGEPAGVIAIEVTDEDAARETIERAADEDEEPGSYEGVDYTIEESGSASGVFDGVIVGASDEEAFRAAVDASRGESMADDEAFADGLDEAPDDALISAYADVDGTLALLTETGAATAEDVAMIREASGFDEGATALASVVAEEDAMTFEVSSDGVEVPEGPTVADLPGGAWLAFAIGGDSFAQGFLRGFETSGGPEAAAIADQLGLSAFLEGLESLSLRLGGEALAELNGSLELVGSNQTAAQTVVRSITGLLQAQGAPIQLEGDVATLSIPPLQVLRLAADGGTVRLTGGEQPEDTIGDGDAFGAAGDRLDLDDVAMFVDFAPLEELLRSLPPDPDVEEALPVIAELGSVAAGVGSDDGRGVVRLVVSLR